MNMATIKIYILMYNYKLGKYKDSKFMKIFKIIKISFNYIW